MDFEQKISPYIPNQFSDFYKEFGQDFIQFLIMYYQFLEEDGYAINAAKNLLNYNDIDTTLDNFLDRFKNQYLLGFPAITPVNRGLLVKRIKDFYQSKGSPESFKLLFRLLFDDDINIYLPGNDVLRASDGIWKIPVYLEVETNDRAKTFVGTQVTGSQSGATAIVDSVYTKIVQQRLIDVLNISDIRGNFQFDELITNDGDLTNAPKITGSLTSIQVVDGGANNNIGDLFNIVSSNTGKSGSARVVATANGTGKVTFTLENGGTGYTLTGNQVYVSQTVFFTSNLYSLTPNTTPGFITFEPVVQPLVSIDYSVSTPSNPNTVISSNIYGWAGGSIVARGMLVNNTTSANTLIINTTNGNFSNATLIATLSNTISFTGYTLTNVNASGIITGVNSTALGLHNINGQFYGNGAFFEGTISNTVATIGVTSTGSGATFEIGSIDNTQTLVLFTDLLSGNNVNDIPFMNMILCGSNSNTGLNLGAGTLTGNTASANVTGSGTGFTAEVIVGSGLYSGAGNVFIGTVTNVANDTLLTMQSNAIVNVSSGTYYYNLGQFGFPLNPSGGYESIISSLLGTNVFSIGTITSLTGINTGTNYNTNPFVAIRNPYIAPYNRRNLILNLTNKTGAFNINDTVSQNVVTSYTTVSYNANVGGFTTGEGVYQTSSNAYATLLSVNSSYIVLDNLRGTFSTNSGGGTALVGLSSNATANLTGISNTTIATLAYGRISSIPSTTSIEVQRASFNEDFIPNTSIFTTSGGSANIVSVSQDQNSPAMGNNAVVSANVTTSVGIATVLQVLSSGWGYQPSDTLELANNTNPIYIVGAANVQTQGIGTGFWEDNRGKLNSDKYIHDNFYYQEFSYEIQSKLSLDKYQDIVTQLAHILGYEMFGAVYIASTGSINMTGESVLNQTNELGLDFRSANNSGYIAAVT